MKDSGLGPVATGSLFDIAGNYHAAWSVCLAFTILALLLVVGLKERGANGVATSTGGAG